MRRDWKAVPELCPQSACLGLAWPDVRRARRDCLTNCGQTVGAADALPLYRPKAAAEPWPPPPPPLTTTPPRRTRGHILAFSSVCIFPPTLLTLYSLLILSFPPRSSHPRVPPLLLFRYSSIHSGAMCSKDFNSSPNDPSFKLQFC